MRVADPGWRTEKLEFRLMAAMPRHRGHQPFYPGSLRMYF